MWMWADRKTPSSGERPGGLEYILDIVQRLNLMLKQIDLIDRMLCGIQRSQTDSQMADFPAVVVTVK